MLGLLTGERQPRPALLRAPVVKNWASGVRRKIGRWVTGRNSPEAGTSMLADLMSKSIRKRLREAPALRGALKAGTAPLAEHLPDVRHDLHR